MQQILILLGALRSEKSQHTLKELFKKASIYSCLIFIIYSCSSQKIVETKREAFAIIIENKIVFLQDTIAFKKKINENLFEKPINFDKIEIKKQMTIGDNSKEFYYVIIRNNKMNLKIVRWLNKVENEFFFINKSVGEDSFELIYQTCIGSEDCDPEVFDIDNQRFWSCSKDPKCRLEPIDAETLKCRGAKSIIIEEIEN